MQIVAERGYLIPAINTDDVDYVECAAQLATSIQDWHPDAHITILTKQDLPFPDQKGFANDWQVFYSSPYRQTIKLEADMICAGPIDHWWSLFENRDVVISQGCRNFYGHFSDSKKYRKIFVDNNLPDVYNAITYWRLSQTAKDFFKIVRSIFDNWDSVTKVLKLVDQPPSTDVVYALAALIIGPELVTLPPGLGPTIVHMKKHIIKTKGDNWTKELVWEYVRPTLRIQTIAQWGLVHYHNKHWRAQ